MLHYGYTMSDLVEWAQHKLHLPGSLLRSIQR